MNLKATIELVKTSEKNGKTYYQFKAGGVYYGSGMKSPGAVGDVIEFDFEENGAFKNAGNIKKVATAPTSSGSSNSGGGAPTDWDKKDRSISWQAARNSANALLAVGASAGYQDFPDTLAKLVEISDKLTLKFWTSSQNPGGTKAPAPKPPPPPEPEQDEFVDEIPF